MGNFIFILFISLFLVVAFLGFVMGSYVALGLFMGFIIGGNVFLLQELLEEKRRK